MRKVRGVPDPIDIAVGWQIRARRRSLGMSQQRLAAALGITFQQVQKYERGANRVSSSMLVRTAQALDTTVAALVSEDEADAPDSAMGFPMEAPGADVLLAAFVEIERSDIRHALVLIAERMGRAAEGPGRRR